MSKKFESAVKFFHENAGYCYNPATETQEEGKRRCALSLAVAEQWAQDNDIEAEWQWDDAPWDGDCPAPDELWGCILKHGDSVASLWSIADPDANYRRVIEAELASELLHIEQDALKDYAGMLS